MRESGKINDIELGSTKTSPLNHTRRLAPRRTRFNFRDRVQRADANGFNDLHQ